MDYVTTGSTRVKWVIGMSYATCARVPLDIPHQLGKIYIGHIVPLVNTITRHAQVLTSKIYSIVLLDR